MNKLPICPYSKLCGGCDYQGIEYTEQLNKNLKLKAEQIIRDMNKEVRLEL